MLTGLADGLAPKERRYAGRDSPHCLMDPPLPNPGWIGNSAVFGGRDGSRRFMESTSGFLMTTGADGRGAAGGPEGDGGRGRAGRGGGAERPAGGPPGRGPGPPAPPPSRREPPPLGGPLPGGSA